MTEIQLIVAADEPALFFASTEDAERYLEPIDVNDGVYTAAFGPGGEPHSISTDGRRVRIEKLDCAPQPDALKAVLRGYLESLGVNVSAELDLPALLRRCHG